MVYYRYDDFHCDVILSTLLHAFHIKIQTNKCDNITNANRLRFFYYLFLNVRFVTVDVLSQVITVPVKIFTY